MALYIFSDDKHPPFLYQKASGHLIFDVRIMLERKSICVKYLHKTPQPEWSTFAGVLSRESIRITLTYAALNNLPTFGADTKNAYLKAPSSEKHYIICDPEFGLEHEGRIATIFRALYGGKSVGADYWCHVKSTMADIKFESCKADPDQWMIPGTRSNGKLYWKFVLLYTDNILAVI